MNLGAAFNVGRRTKKSETQKMPTMRRSCDFCNGRKKKCDGDGINPCSYCIEKKNPHCIYSPRKTQTKKVRKAAHPPQAAIAGPSTATATNSSHYHHHHQQQQQQLGLGTLARPCLKRGRFGPSQATGLVGTQENVFLSDFFRCMGFLPLTCESAVREAMIRLLFDNNSDLGGSSSNRDWPNSNGGARAIMMDDNGYQQGGTSIVSAATADSQASMGMRKHQQSSASGPSTCIFWCAVALGALTQGRPIDSVATYVRLAESALDDSRGAATTAVARAWTLMAFLHGYCGDPEKFRGCQRKAQQLVDSLVEPPLEHEGDSIDRAEVEMLIDHADGIGLFYGDGTVLPGQVSSFLEKGPSQPKATGMTTMHELWLFVRRSYRGFGQAFFTDILEKGDQGMSGSSSGGIAAEAEEAAVSASRSELSALLCDEDGDEDEDDDDDVQGGDLFNLANMNNLSSNTSGWSADASGAMGIIGGDGAPGRNSTGNTGGCGVAEQVQELARQRGTIVLIGPQRVEMPGHSGWNMKRMMKDAEPEYDRLECTVDRQGVRDTIGGLMINCTSVVLKAAKGDARGAAERISRCVEILKRYPGLMRFCMGLHFAHLLVAVSAGLDDRQLYTALMAAYNPVRPAGSPPIPPFEEWQGMAGICSHVYCSLIDSRFGSKARDQQQLTEATPARAHHQNGGIPTGSSVTAAAAAAAAVAATCAEGEGGCYGEGVEGVRQEPAPYAGSGCFSAGEGGEGVPGPGLNDEPLTDAMGALKGVYDHRHQYQRTDGAAIAAALSLPQSTLQASANPGDDLVSTGDLDGVTLCGDIDPLVTHSQVGLGYQALPRSMKVQVGRNRTSAVGFHDPRGLVEARPQKPMTPIPLPSTHAAPHNCSSSGASTNPSDMSSSSIIGNSISSSKAACSSRGGVVALGGRVGSIDAIEAVLIGEDDCDDDDEDVGGGGGFELDMLEGLLEVKPTYLLLGEGEETYKGKHVSITDNHRREAREAYCETEESLATGSFLEATDAMLYHQQRQFEQAARAAFPRAA